MTTMEYPNKILLSNQCSDVFQSYRPFQSQHNGTSISYHYGCVTSSNSFQPLQQQTAWMMNNRPLQYYAMLRENSTKLIPWPSNQCEQQPLSGTFGAESTSDSLYRDYYTRRLTHQEDTLSFAMGDIPYDCNQLCSQTVPSLQQHCDFQTLSSAHRGTPPDPQFKLTIDGSCCNGSDGVPSPYTPPLSNTPSSSSSVCDGIREEDTPGAKPLPDHLQTSKVELMIPAYRTHLSKRQPRKDRLCFTLNQLKQLEASFSKRKYLNLNERQQLADKIDISQLQVKTWYQNRRTKWKRNEKMTN